MSGGPIQVGQLLDGFLEQQGVKRELERLGVLTEWAECVGERIAQVTRARSVSDRTLLVEVRSSAWMMELNMMKGAILERLNEGHERAPIEHLRFVLAPEG